MRRGRPRPPLLVIAAAVALTCCGAVRNGGGKVARGAMAGGTMVDRQNAVRAHQTARAMRTMRKAATKTTVSPPQPQQQQRLLLRPSPFLLDTNMVRRAERLLVRSVFGRVRTLMANPFFVYVFGVCSVVDCFYCDSLCSSPNILFSLSHPVKLGH